MTEEEYLNKHYPQDFICIQNEFFPLPQGGKIDIEDKEISSVFTTADGSKRKDIIRKYKAVSIKFSVLTQKDFERVCEIITKIDNAFYDESKYLFLKKENMPINHQSDFKTFFTAIKIDIVHPIKYSHSFRKNTEFLYSGITLKIN
ncbi:hypothetical protein [Treponema pedis]|uniref:hypothetical protein n=1 Tax=Treponema pedis TaxID=409322 RepID=UPI003140E31D